MSARIAASSYLLTPNLLQLSQQPQVLSPLQKRDVFIGLCKFLFGCNVPLIQWPSCTLHLKFTHEEW